MRGLWGLQTQLLNLGLHRAVLNTVFFFILLCLTALFVKLPNSELWPEFRLLTSSSILLTA